MITPARCLRTVAAAAALAALPAAADDIAVGHHRLHIDCVGRGSPTVVLDAGLGGSALEWTPVVGRLRRITRVCTYDRAGYGASDTIPGPRTSSRIANELFLLLSGAGEAPPYILAGHSFGGYNMQIFARRYAYLSAGLVLIDASHPTQVERFLAPPLRMLTAPSSRYGIVQFRDPPAPHARLPAPIRRAIAARASRPHTRRALGAELLAFRDSAREVEQSMSLGDLPLVVITRGRTEGAEGARKLAIESLWLELQAELAAESRVSVHLIARDSGHHVHIEQPELVSYAIELLVDRFRAALPGGDGARGAAQWAALREPLNGVSWLHDTLDPSPAPLLSAAPACPLGVACAWREPGAP